MRLRVSMPLAIVAVGACLSACGPIQATTSIVRAEEELRTARLAAADRDAPYEFTKAKLLLEMAKERNGFSEFQAAKEFADESQRLAAAAKENAPRNARLRQIRAGARPPVQAPAPALPSPAAPGVPAPANPGGGR